MVPDAKSDGPEPTEAPEPTDGPESADKPEPTYKFASEDPNAPHPFAEEMERVKLELEGKIPPRELVPRATRGPAPSRTKPIAIRFDQFTLERLKTLADRRDRPYQTMLKEFVIERLYEEERREGIIE